MSFGESVSSLFSCLLSSPEIISQIIQAFENILHSSQVIEDAGRDIAARVDPTVAIAIENLKYVYQRVGLKARVCINACKEVALYVCESGVLEAIMNDLEERKSTKELSSFLKNMQEYLKHCGFCIDQFNKIQTQFTKQLNQGKDQWSDELTKTEEKEKSSHDSSHQYGTYAKVLGAGGAAFGAIAAANIICPPTAAVTLAAVAFTGATISYERANKFATEKGICNEKKKVFVDAGRQVIDLYEKLTKFKVQINCTVEDIETVKTCIGSDTPGTRPGLTELVAQASSDGYLDRCNIKSNLANLKETMQTTLKKARVYLEMQI